MRVTPAQERRLMAWAKTQPQKKFPSIEAAVRYLRREFARKD